MAHSDFVHLRVHSAYSLSEGAVRVKDLVKRCQDLAMPAVAITDSNNLFGAMEFSLSAAGAGVQPIIGAQVSLSRSLEEHPPGKEPAPDKIALMVQNEQGYQNLLKLISKAFMESGDGEDAQVDYDDLERWNEGLLLLSGGPDGPINQALGRDQAAQALQSLQRLQSIYPGRFYIELQRHNLEAEELVEDRLIDLAYEHDLPLVATNDAFFLDEDMFEAHDALLCIAEGAYVAQDERRRVTPEHRFKTAEEMKALFADVPEAIQNTLVVARRCAYRPVPIDPILPAYDTEGGRTETEELRAQSFEGLEHRLEKNVFLDSHSADEKASLRKEYEERLEFELGIIEQMGFPGYFLIVSDFIKWAKEQGIPVGPGRGSGAGSLVAYSLLITDLDPIRWGLLFERFLNPERVSMPDFDVDFCQDRRDEVIRYVQEKYGRDRVAQIITFGKLQARAALRDVGRVLQLPFGQVDRICKLVPNNPANPTTLSEALEIEPRLKEEQASDENTARMIEIALKLEGLYRHASTHAAGVVIGDRPLDELVPLYRDPRSDMPVTQFNMKFVEQAGLVKFDFLGLKTLTVMATAEKFIRRHTPDFELAALHLEDEPAYKVMAAGETVGVFQLESQGMRDALKKLRPDRFEDVIAMVSLYRPGPMENIPSYINRKKGEEDPDYLHDSLKPILEETFGIMIYQEQVMQIAQVLSGYSLGGADMLRRAMGKKIKEEMDKQRKIFVQGAKEKGVDPKQADNIFDLVNKFAGYGFNKSHAAAYALIAYYTAYLKANHPVEFMAASMTFDMTNTDKLNVFRQELDRMGIALLPPDINASRATFNVEDLPPEALVPPKDADPDLPPPKVPTNPKGVRYALGAVRNVGAAAMDLLVAGRKEEGPFASVAEFARRIDSKSVNKRLIENLAAAGAFDELNSNRCQVHKGAETIVRHAATVASEREMGQFNLLGSSGHEDTIKLPAVPDWPSNEKLQAEFAAIGFYLSAHPLDAYGRMLQRKKVVTFADLPKAAATNAGRQTLAGIVLAKQERTSKRGNRFAFVSLSDSTGVFEVTLFSETLGRCRDLLEGGKPLLVQVSVERQPEGDDLRLTAQDFEDLDEALAKTAAGLKIYANSTDPLSHLNAILQRERKGRGKMDLVLSLENGREVELELPGSYALSSGGRQAIKSIPGLVVEDT
ncbi:DNA polymerase III subunit alpha [Rhodovibrionaceae bacterium A322]